MYGCGMIVNGTNTFGTGHIDCDNTFESDNLPLEHDDNYISFDPVTRESSSFFHRSYKQRVVTDDLKFWESEQVYETKDEVRDRAHDRGRRQWKSMNQTHSTDQSSKAFSHSMPSTDSTSRVIAWSGCLRASEGQNPRCRKGSTSKHDKP
ncbi:uncharacterized protein MELLADRAFT_107150 [Melampsora larici-populina 98AG31]|uniref:Uncharacterized protein n=1 Tax=Melampsora larici-populina (strain 98AG31 / pathotype 3-4-7) TaxID=747676 RepID=F4RP07_MELLP|nr:uncharacterized protein MELLADRAFT_107150 [Melampsora larici-populina 98AG31]EGG05938.1 hypothetical protein MELLADRAFT_107150 [Melampsora larici-populina 98AG31]